MNSHVLVTGAPGNVGTEVVHGLQSAGISFRVGAFDVQHARAVFGDNTEIVHFDLLKPETYQAAFAGIERMFFVRPPVITNVQRDIAPALQAAVASGVRHIVFLSLQGVERNRIVPHHKIERLIREIGVDYTFLRASFFMQNLSTTHAAEIRILDEIAVPVGKAKTSFIDVRDIAAVAVRALTEDEHANREYTLTGTEALDYSTVAAKLSLSLGRPIKYTCPNAFTFLHRQLARGQKFGYVLVLTGLYTITRFGNAEAVTKDVEVVLQRPPISFDQFTQDYRACWMKGVDQGAAQQV